VTSHDAASSGKVRHVVQQNVDSRVAVSVVG